MVPCGGSCKLNTVSVCLYPCCITNMKNAFLFLFNIPCIVYIHVYLLEVFFCTALVGALHCVTWHIIAACRSVNIAKLNEYHVNHMLANVYMHDNKQNMDQWTKPLLMVWWPCALNVVGVKLQNVGFGHRKRSNALNVKEVLVWQEV